MPLAKLTIEIEIPHAQSLKDRRQVIRSLKDKLRHSFNLSIAELDDGIVWNRATLGIAAISSSTSYLTGQIQLIDRAVHRLATTLGIATISSSTSYLTGQIQQIEQAAHRIAATLSAEILDSYAEILPD